MTRYTYSDLQSFVATMYRNKPFFMRPYAYPVEFLNVAAAATSTQFLTIQANGDFTLTEIASFVSSVAATPAPIAPLGAIQIVDTGSNEKWTNDLTPVLNYAGNGIAPGPFYLAFPRFVQGNTQLQIQFRNDGAFAANLYLTLRGVTSKIFSN